MTLAVVLAPVPGVAQSSSPVSSAIAQGMAALDQNYWAYWNSLTPRQQYLEKALQAVEEGIRRKTGSYIPVRPDTHRTVMEGLRAHPSEAAWVWHRMVQIARIDEIENGSCRQFLAVYRNACATLGMFCNEPCPLK